MRQPVLAESNGHDFGDSSKSRASFSVLPAGAHWRAFAAQTTARRHLNLPD